MKRLSEVEWSPLRSETVDAEIYVSEMLENEAATRKMVLLAIENNLVAGIVFRESTIYPVAFSDIEQMSETESVVCYDWYRIFKNGADFSVDYYEWTYEKLGVRINLEMDRLVLPREVDVQVAEPVVEIEHAKVSQEWYDRTYSQFMMLLQACDIYSPKEDSVKKNLDIWKASIEKVGEDGTSMLDKFMSNPYYNGNGQIVLKEEEFNTGINHEVIKSVLDRIKGIIIDHFAYNCEPKFGFFTLNDISKMYGQAKNNVNALYDLHCSTGDDLHYHKIKGYDYFHWYNEREKYEAFYTKYKATLIYNPTVGKYLTHEDSEKLGKLVKFIAWINKTSSEFSKDAVVTTAEFCEFVNENFGTNYVAGTKMNKVIWKLFNKECPWIQESSDFIWEVKTYTNNDGTTRTVKPTCKDKLGDALNPTIIKGTSVLSINFIDYMTMSFGTDWRSCHNIDKKQRAWQVNGYYADGCCAAGPMSYALDSSSMVFYQLKGEETIYGNIADEYELALIPKRYRNMFHYQDYRLIQSRVYPQTLDSSDDLRDQFRNVVQGIFADMLHMNNSWTVSKGSQYNNTITDGLHYADYEHSDFRPNISTIKETGKLNFQQIHIGNTAYCINCGNENHNGSAIECSRCYTGDSDDRDVIAYCYRCDDPIYENDYDYIYCEYNGNYYCCESCANDADVYYVGGEWRSTEEDYVYRCNRCGEVFYGYYGDNVVYTEDGNEYCCRSCAERDGYVEAMDQYEDYRWVQSEETFTDTNNGYAYILDDWDYIVINGDYFRDEDSATDYGCVYIESTETWYINEDKARENGCVYVDDNETWYANIDEVSMDGYTINEDGEFVFADNGSEVA